MNIKSLAETIAKNQKFSYNGIEYKLTLDEYFNLRNTEYYKLVNDSTIIDSDDNWDEFDSHLGSFLNVNWG